MKRLLLLAGLVGFAAYLLTPSRTPPMEPTETVSTAQAPRDRQTRGPLGSSWGSSLRSLTQDPDAAFAESQQAAPYETAGSGPRPHTETQEWQPTRGAQPSVSVDHASAPGLNDPEREAVEWVKNLTKEIQVGEVYEGKVLKILHILQIQVIMMRFQHFLHLDNR